MGIFEPDAGRGNADGVKGGIAMYTPAHFAEISATEIAAVIAAAPLACIVAQTADGLIANHIPLLAASDGTLIGHVALANDMHRLVADGQEVLVIFRSDDAYVSPNYYLTKPEHHRHVPTWNYQAVHVYGGITFQHDTYAKRVAVGLLTRIHERRLNGDNAWRMADAPADYMEQMLDSIVAFRIAVRRTLAKSKLSQNREERDYLGVVAGLDKSGHDAMATRMRGRLPKKG
jgi:transcriptional regulator